jgi:Zn finger protein HypA/HybF involved in hydrogenase expression
MVDDILVHERWENFPKLFKEINLNKNLNHTMYGNHIHVYQLKPGTNKKIDWICSVCDNEWQSMGSNRSMHGRGCPACSNQQIHIDGRNSLASTHPDLAKELVSDANSVVAGTNKKLTWCCSKCQHIWKASGAKRAFSGRNCPACVNKEIHIDGRNSMAKTHPQLASELIGDASKIIAGTHKRLDWHCSVCEHEWKSLGSTRAQGAGCPACSNQQIHIDGRNSMANTHPELAIELVGDPSKIISGTNKKLSWKCQICSHKWEAKGSHRADGVGCPSCSNREVHIDGRNSLSVISPSLSKELIGNPKTVVATTDAILTWKCDACSHIWKTSGYHRVTRESGCPSCADYGFQAGEPGYYYVLKILNNTDDLLYYKGGITSSIDRRMRQISLRLPSYLKLVLHNYIEFDIGQDARDLETMLLSVFEIRAPKRDFQGGSELFLSDPLEYARYMNWV